jgi:hypothetical protein
VIRLILLKGLPAEAQEVGQHA